MRPCWSAAKSIGLVANCQLLRRAARDSKRTNNNPSSDRTEERERRKEGRKDSDSRGSIIELSERVRNKFVLSQKIHVKKKSIIANLLAPNSRSLVVV